jgi:HemY protein
MIRFIIFLLATAGLAFAAVWLADRPGAVSIDWLGYHTDTSVGVLIGAVLAIVCVVLILWSLLGLLLRAPGRLRRGSRARRTARGHHAITQGLVAIGAGDLHAALRHARDAARHAGDQPLTLLLQAQTAQLAGTRNGADSAFRAMADKPETKLLGLRGLFIEAQRRNDAVAARGFAEEAAKEAPSLAWAGQATFDFHCADGDWAGALEALERNNRGGLLDRDTYRRQRAVLLTAQALSLAATDRAAASALAQEAVKLCPGLTPAATLACSRKPANGDGPDASSKLRGARSRIPTSPTPMPTSCPERRHASGWRACARWRGWPRATWKAGWRSPAPRLTRTNSPRRGKASSPCSRPRPGGLPR